MLEIKSLIDFYTYTSKVLIIIVLSECIICCSFAENPDSVVQSYFSRFEEQWFSYCNEELEKINTFFAGKLNIKTSVISNL